MRPKITLITLGVRDLARAIAFYETGLGWKRSSASQDDVVFFDLGGVVLSLWPRDNLAEDAHLSPTGSGFSGIALAHNVKTEREVDEVLAQVATLGATVVKPAEKVFWGGYSGYFTDPDGHLFEVAYNPGFPLDERDNIVLP